MCLRILLLTLTVVSARNNYLFNLRDHYAAQPHVDYGSTDNSRNERHIPYGFQRREVQYNTPANFNTEPRVDQGYIYGSPRSTDHYSYNMEYHNRNFQHTSNMHQTNLGTRSHQTFDYGSENVNRQGGSDRQDSENRNQFEYHSKIGFNNPNFDQTEINLADNSRINQNRRSYFNNGYDSGNGNLEIDFSNPFTSRRSQNIVLNKNNEFNNSNSSGEVINQGTEVKKTTADNEIVTNTTEKVKVSREDRNNSTGGVNVKERSKGNRSEVEEKWIWDSSNTTTTTIAPELDNRSVFTGDQCPTNMAKISGKCVEID